MRGDGESTADDLVTYEVDGGVALLTWNRPQRKNAWTPELEEAYFGRLRQAAGDAEVRAIVVTGAGRHFCPGTDMQRLSSAANGDRNRPPEERDSQTLPMTIPKPIVAAIHGSCAGTGFIQACVSDIRFVEPDARLTPAFARRGIMAEQGISVLLPALLGMFRSLDILLSARVITGQEAAEMGFARLSTSGQALSDALDYAGEIARSCSPVAMAITKEQVYGHIREPLEHARRDALRIWADLREHGDFKEGVASYVERRPPQFAPLTHTSDVTRWVTGDT